MGEARHGRNGGSSGAERLMSMDLNPEVLHDEGAFDRLHAKIAKAFTSDHARRFWQKKQAATLGAR
jgi:hypothetical protein